MNLREKLLSFFTNPAILFLILSILLGVVLYYMCGFKLPDYYTDRELANHLAQYAPVYKVEEYIKHLINDKYIICNTLFQIWGYFVAITIFCLIFKVQKFKYFKEFSVFNSKKIYYFINLSYIIWGIFAFFIYVLNSHKYTGENYLNPYYFSNTDIFYIMFGILIAIFYYPIANFLCYLTFKPTGRHLIFYLAIWLFCLFELMYCAFTNLSLQFTPFTIFLDLIQILWLVILLYMIKHKLNKKNDIIKS